MNAIRVEIWKNRRFERSSKYDGRTWFGSGSTEEYEKWNIVERLLNVNVIQDLSQL